MGVDRLARDRLEPEPERRQPRVEDGVIPGRERWKVLNTRRERTSRSVQGTLLWS